jgi:hypothetical protein
MVAATGVTAIKLGGLYDSITVKLKAAQSDLAKMVKAAASADQSTVDAINKLGDITQGSPVAFTGSGQNAEATGASDMIANLGAAVAKARAFGGALKELQRDGLNQTSLNQLIAAGPTQGLQAAKALLAGGHLALERVNDLQAQLSKIAQSTGASASQAMYGAGVAAAQGLVKGLQSQESLLLAQLTRLISGMVTTVKKHLKIKSPSGVFADEVGAQIPAGIAQGIAAGMPAVTTALAGVGKTGAAPSFGPVGVIPGSGGTTTLNATFTIMLDGQAVGTYVQKYFLKNNGRNTVNGLALKAGR